MFSQGCGIMYIYVLFCVIFFFKQKTAYEMRISDWSSDVCSSDLPAEIVIDPLVAAERARRDGEARAPRRGAGKVSNTKIVVPVKRTQPIERDRGRGAEVRREGDLPRPRKRCRRGDAARLDRARAERIGAVAPDQQPVVGDLDRRHVFGPRRHRGRGIGSAAGRGRVCQYVSISVVAVSVQKQKTHTIISPQT